MASSPGRDLGNTRYLLMAPDGCAPTRAAFAFPREAERFGDGKRNGTGWGRGEETRGEGRATKTSTDASVK